MTVAYPHNNPDQWDSITIGQNVFPGIIQDVYFSNTLSYEIIRKRNYNKSRIKYKGREPREITVQLLILNEEQFNSLEQIKKSLYVINPSKKQVKPFEVSHPKINSAGIKKVWYKDYDEGYPDAAYGFIVTLTLLEDLDSTQFVIDEEAEKVKKNKLKGKGKKAGKAAGATTNRDPATGITNALS